MYEVDLKDFRKIIQAQSDGYFKSLNRNLYQLYLNSEDFFPRSEFIKKYLCHIEGEDRKYFVEFKNKELSICACLKMLQWDSELLDVPTGNLEWFLFLLESPDEDVSLFLENILKGNKKLNLVYARVSTDDLRTLPILEKNGFRVADVSQVFTYRGKYLKILDDNQEKVSFKNYVPAEDDNFIENLASGSFKHGRFFTDTRISDNKAAILYKKMAGSFLRKDKNALVRIAEIDGEKAGFWIGAIDEVTSKILQSPFGYLCLIAIKPEYRGMGLGRVLINNCFNTFRGHVETIEICTQIQNTAALNLYTQAGCRIVASYVTMHYWR
ncbi:MAG: GNAT family N-acetyltransferase [Candidatus Brocadiales bacterium]|nr:GNAT family N-acetyltransferase [Candidatus Brocadiales bacterium]